MLDPPCKGRFLDQFVGNCILSHLNRVGFLQVFQRNLVGASVFPLHLELPASGCTFWNVNAFGVNVKTIILGYGMSIHTVVNYIAENREASPFFINLQEYVLCNEVCSDSFY